MTWRRAAGVLLLGLGALPVRADHWAPPPPLPASGLERGDQFGSAVAIAGNVVAVGAYTAGRGAGAVYLYRQVGGAWAPVSARPLAGPEGSRSFGFDVALDPAGQSLLVGAPATGACGAAFLYDLADLSSPTPLGPPDGACRPGDEFGSAVALGVGLHAVGARGADEKRGRVYVARRGGGFRPVAADGLVAGSELGQSLAVDGPWLVMGAPAPYPGSRSPGAAYVVDLAGADPLRAVALPLPALAAGAAFGYAVAVSGERIAVGAPLHDRQAGAVLSYRRDAAGAWRLEGAALAAGAAGDQLGVAVALDGAYLVAGARYADRGGARDAGAAYLEGHGELASPRRQSGAQFGFAAAVRGATAVVGAFRQDGSGAAYVFMPQDLPLLRLSAPATVTEGDQGRGSFTVTIEVVGGAPLAHDVTVDLSTTPVSAKAGEDYAAISDEIEIEAGSTSATVSLEIVGDTVCERHETFKVRLSDPTGARLGAPDEVEVTIRNDDAGDIVLSPAAVLTAENGPPVPLEVRLTCQPAAPVTVSLSASPPLATFVPAQVRFVPERWETPARVQVLGVDDTDCEPGMPVSYTITASSTSTDPVYRPGAIDASHVDDDVTCVSGTKKVCPDDDGTVVYTVVLSNDGSVAQEDAASHELLDTLPPQLSVVLASATSGVATVDYAGDAVAWNGPIPPGADVVTITIVAALHEVAEGTEVSNHARLTFDSEGDGSPEIARTDDPATEEPEDPTIFAVGDTCSPTPPG